MTTTTPGTKWRGKSRHRCSTRKGGAVLLLLSKQAWPLPVAMYPPDTRMHAVTWEMAPPVIYCAWSLPCRSASAGTYGGSPFHQNRKFALACWVCSWYKCAQLNSKVFVIPCPKSGRSHWRVCSSGRHFCGKSKPAQDVLWNPLTSEFLLLCLDVLKLSALQQQQRYC